MARKKKKHSASISLTTMPVVKFNKTETEPARILTLDVNPIEWLAKNAIWDGIDSETAGLYALFTAGLERAVPHYKWRDRPELTSEEATAEFLKFSPEFTPRSFNVVSIAQYRDESTASYIQKLSDEDLREMLEEQGYVVTD